MQIEMTFRHPEGTEHMTIVVPVLCPCGRGERSDACCFVGGAVTPKQRTITQPSGSFQHRKCYASALSGCSSEANASLEHFFSRGILERMPDLVIRGGRIAGDKNMPANPSFLQSRCLCKDHNSALSPLDTGAIALHDALSRMKAHLSNPSASSPPAMFVTSGHDLERWMMKCLLGMIASGNAITQAGVPHPKTWRAPRRWLDVLFGLDMLHGVGLHLVLQPNTVMSAMDHHAAASITDPRTKMPLGVSLNFQGLHFLLEIDPIPPEVKHALWPTRRYRPQYIIMRNERNAAALFLGWDNATHGGASLVRMLEVPPEGGAGLLRVPGSPPTRKKHYVP